MHGEIYDTLETIANLLYLARVSLDRKETADAYLAMAEDVLKAAAESGPEHPSGSVGDASTEES